MEKDLKEYVIRTDLAIEEDFDNSNIIKRVNDYNGVIVTNIRLLSDFGCKKMGNYVTIEFDDVTDYDNKKRVEDIFSREIKKFIGNYNFILVVGLGNRKSTCDSIGPLVNDNIIVTNHLYELGLLDKGFKRVAVFNPDVTGNTGCETLSLIKGVVDNINPDLVILVDSLASSSIDHVNKTIQITDTGISPGSGVGNGRKEISFSTLGKRVIGIGVPTVVDASTIVYDTINYMYKFYAYSLKNYNNPINRFVVSPNYLRDSYELSNDDKRNLLGIVGSLSNSDVKQLIYEVLSPIGYNLMVTPKEEDFEVKKLSEVIGNGLNRALNKNVTHL